MSAKKKSLSGSAGRVYIVYIQTRTSAGLVVNHYAVLFARSIKSLMAGEHRLCSQSHRSLLGRQLKATLLSVFIFWLKGGFVEINSNRARDGAKQFGLKYYLRLPLSAGIGVICGAGVGPGGNKMP